MVHTVFNRLDKVNRLKHACLWNLTGRPVPLVPFFGLLWWGRVLHFDRLRYLHAESKHDTADGSPPLYLELFVSPCQGNNGLSPAVAVYCHLRPKSVQLLDMREVLPVSLRCSAFFSSLVIGVPLSLVGKLINNVIRSPMCWCINTVTEEN